MKSNNKIENIFVFLSILLIVITLSLSTTVFAEQYSLDVLTYSGGTISGNSNLMANGISAIGKQFLGINGTVTSNPTMAQVLVLLENEADIATVMGYQTSDAYKGIGDWKDKPFPEVRLLLQGDPCGWVIAVLEDSSIHSIKDLVGKRVVVGKMGFVADDITRRLFKVLDISYDKITPLYLGNEDAAAGLLAGKADAYISMSTPSQTITEMTLAHNIRVIGLNEEEMEKTLKGIPGCQRYILPGGTYKGNNEDILAPSFFLFYACKANLPEDVAYGLVKNFWEHQEFAALQYAGLALYKLEDIPSFTDAPWHIGAYKYYKEKGLVIPEDMIPPEAK